MHATKQRRANVHCGDVGACKRVNGGCEVYTRMVMVWKSVAAGFLIPTKTFVFISVRLKMHYTNFDRANSSNTTPIHSHSHYHLTYYL